MSSEDNLLKPGEIIKPQLNQEKVPQLLLKLYGLVADAVKSLNSYDDLNFLVKVKSGSTSNPHIQQISSTGYVLKVMNSLDSRSSGIVEGQNAMMIHLSQRGYNCPVPQKTLQGEYCTLQRFEEDNDNGVGHLVRLLSFVPGTLLFSVPLTPALCSDAGSYIARLERDLEGFSHPSISSRQFLWQCSSTPLVRQFLHAVTDAGRLALVTTALDNWEKALLPVLDSLPKGYIHGDFNEQNILVSSPGTASAPQQYSVSGVIDFGDISVNCYVFEVAIIAMSLLTIVNEPSLAGHAIAGYNSQRPLQEEEWDVLWESVCGRLCMSLVLGAYSHSLDPSNTYLLTTAATGWAALQTLLQQGKTATLQLWRDLC